jgi:hypothetical protein
MSVAAAPAVQNTLVVQQPAAAAAPPLVGLQPAETRMILIVGANVALMEWAALSLYRAGHIPVLGQWFWPLVASGGFDGDAEHADPVAERLIGRCDAVLRVGDPAPEPEALVGAARARGLRVYTTLDEALAG